MERIELQETLTRINAHRHGRAAGEKQAGVHRSEDLIETRFAASHRLAVYGSLIPGRSNAGVLDGMGGEWEAGCVHGHLHDRGWGSESGYPGLIWSPGGPEVAVHLLVSPQLVEQWPRLDAFEGDEYCRVLVPVYRASQLTAVANLYELRDHVTAA